ncbi:phage regulatory protein [Clostridium sediminicola]|uniref:ORF6C domain-containing protein n=1 Tax=Clostridium sediminicola TaxID=3114879 RepID=UPI0031F27E60
MKNLIEIKNHNGRLVVLSREMAINFKMSHPKLLRKIENLILENPKLASLGFFIETKYKTGTNKRTYKEYEITRDGFSLLVMSFTGYKSFEWKMKYIEAFNKMEESLRIPYQGLSKELKAIFVLDKKTCEIENRIAEVEETAYILPFQKKALIKARSRKVIGICGGKNSYAYQNRSFRSKVYSDLFKSIMEIYQINEYDAIPRKKFHEAMEIIENYELPIHLKYAKEKVTSDKLQG